jgi:hypothetical protein
MLHLTQLLQAKYIVAVRPALGLCVHVLQTQLEELVGEAQGVPAAQGIPTVHIYSSPEQVSSNMPNLHRVGTITRPEAAKALPFEPPPLLSPAASPLQEPPSLGVSVQRELAVEEARKKLDFEDAKELAADVLDLLDPSQTYYPSNNDARITNLVSFLAATDLTEEMILASSTSSADIATMFGEHRVNTSVRVRIKFELLSKGFKDNAWL